MVSTVTEAMLAPPPPAENVHITDLAGAVGIDHTGPLNPHTGWVLTCLLQGRSDLIPLTTGWPTPPTPEQRSDT